MKKIYSLALVLALLLSLSTPALAEEPLAELEGPGSTDVSVNAVYEEGIKGGTIFSIDITWENMSFTYKGESEDTWDPDTHSYNATAAEAGWTEDSVGTITVENHSNAFLTLQCNYVAKSGFEETKMQYAYSKYDSENIGVVYSAEINNTAQTTTITVKPDGTLPENTPTTTIGNIRLTIGEWSEPNIDDSQNLATSASHRLDEFNETQDETTKAEQAIDKLRDAAIAAESDTRSSQLAMMEAYIDLSTIMVNLGIKYAPSTP